MERELLMICEKRSAPANRHAKLASAEDVCETRATSEAFRYPKPFKLGVTHSQQEMRGSKQVLFSFSLLWFWEVIVFSTLAIVSVLLISPSWFPLAYIRWIFGLAILLYVPGFSFVRALFYAKKIGWIEEIVLSVSFSLILTIAVGLCWNFTSLGLSETPIVVTLAAFSDACATAAVLKNNQTNALA